MMMMMMTKRLCVLRPTVRFSAQRWYQYQQEHRRHMSHAASSPYKAVIFDMYGVLLPSPVKLASVFEQQSGVPPGTLGRAIRAGGERNAWRSFMRGELGAQEFVEAFGQQCSDMAGCPVPIGQFLSALTSGPMREPLPLMMEAIKCVRFRGLKTAVLSNNFLTLEGTPFMPLDPSLFDVSPPPLLQVVESCREGLSKPDGRIYQRCLDRLGVAAHHAVFLDDLRFNVRAAAGLGLTAIQVEEPAAAVRDLEEVLGFPLSLSGGAWPRASGAWPGAWPPPTDQLTQYLRTRLHLDDTDVVSVQPVESSRSLHLLTSGGRHLLLRTQQPGSPALETEHRVLTALSGSDLPVPQIIDYSEDPSLGGRVLLMEVCPGRRFPDPSLPGVAPEERAALYQAVTRTLSQIHSLQLRLEDHGVPVRSLAQQVQSWTLEYRASQTRSIPASQTRSIPASQTRSIPASQTRSIPASQTRSIPASQTRSIPAMERLISWLPLHLPKHHDTTLVHGDFSMSKLVFHPERAEVVCVLDWGAAAMGDPLLDLASSCIAHHLPPGLGDLEQLGMPTTEDLIGRYCSSVGAEPPAHWRFYAALWLFHLAASRQQGAAERLAELAWDYATKEGFRLFNAAAPRGGRAVS